MENPPENLTGNVNSKKILDFLSGISLFKQLTETELLKLAQKFEWVPLNGGQLLMKQHEMGDCLYIVYQGRLRATTDFHQQETIVGEIGPGELVGEVALILGRSRVATIHAIRDSLLLKLSKAEFDTFILQNPKTMIDIAK